MSLTCTPALGATVMASNQHRDERRRADTQLLTDAITHLRHQAQHAIPSGWSAATSEDGRHLIVSGSSAFEEIVAETTGVWAEPVQAYLLTVQPLHVLSLLALLEDLARDLAAGDVSPATRGHVIELAAKILGQKRPGIDTRKDRERR